MLSSFVEFVCRVREDFRLYGDSVRVCLRREREREIETELTSETDVDRW